MGNYITTYTRKHFDPINPDAELICIEDIAHALPMICRGNGHVSSFWSVGEHCILCAKEAAAKAEAERKRQEEEAEKRGETVKPAEKVAEPQPVYKVRTTKNVSIKTVAKTASWRLESKDDVDKYLAVLRENLLKEMDENTIVNIEL